MNESVDNEMKSAVLSYKFNLLILVIVMISKRTVVLLVYAV